MNDHIHKWEQNKYFECALQCTECRKIVGDNEVANLANVLTAELAALRAELETVRKAANNLIINLPESEIDLAREVWGNTNANIVLNYRNELAAALRGQA